MFIVFAYFGTRLGIHGRGVFCRRFFGQGERQVSLALPFKQLLACLT